MIGRLFHAISAENRSDQVATKSCFSREPIESTSLAFATFSQMKFCPYLLPLVPSMKHTHPSEGEIETDCSFSFNILAAADIPQISCPIIVITFYPRQTPSRYIFSCNHEFANGIANPRNGRLTTR
jgi:hypothetical protein